MLGACTGDDDAPASILDAGPTGAAYSVTGRFSIPAGTTVQLFSFALVGDAPDFDSNGKSAVVSIRDFSHPARDQRAVCSSNHPLAGCATVDYGAFGTSYDNRISVGGSDGDVQMHMYKDRSIGSGPEPLLDSD